MYQLEMLIAKAKYFEKTQKQIAEKVGIAETKFSDWKKGKTKPSAFEIMRIAELARLEPVSTFFEVMAELDKEHEEYWKKIDMRSAGLEPTPQASETCTLSS